MFSMFEAARILGKHSGLIQWGNTRLPEAEQALSEVRALADKYRSTLDALVPLMPKLAEGVKDVQAFLKKHETGLKELGKAIPEFQAMIDEFLPLVQQAQQFAATQQDKENSNA